MQKLFLPYMIVGLLNLLQPNFLYARNAPVTTAGSSIICPGSATTVPITVNGFTTIKAVTLRLDFDPTMLTFVNYTNLNTSLASASVNYVNVSPVLTKIMIVWADINALTLANGSKLLDLNFTLISGSPVVLFNNTDNGGGDCEYADETGAPMNDVPTSTYYFNATITNNTVAPASTITGAGILCAGTSNVPYSVPVIANATGYIWTVPTGGSIFSGNNTPSIVVNYSTSATSGVVTVKGTNVCGQGASSSLAITINPLPVPAITGPGTVCSGSTNLNYTTEAGMSNYVWTISPGGMITAGAATNSVLVNWNTAGSQSLTVTYTIPATGCVAATPASKTIMVLASPTPTITGSTSVCLGSAGNVYATEPGMTGYQWNVSAGGSVTAGGGTTSNTVTVTWNATVPQSVSVNYTNTAGCNAQTPAVSIVSVNPLPAPAISGPATVCVTTTGAAYTTETGMTNYLWTISPGGTITSGAGTSTILVSWNIVGSQSIGLNYTDGNGCTANTPVSKNVTVVPFPGDAGTISGTDTVCAGTSGVIYSVPPIANATTYDWTVPAGAIINSGAGTSQISLSFSATPGAGFINVKGTSVCGSGAVSPDFIVNMIESQAAPVVTASGPLLTSTTPTGNQWYYEGTGAISGATGQTYTATITGWYWTVVMGVGCPSIESNHVYVLFTGREELQNDNFNIYPVPCEGIFNISITSSSSETCTIFIYNQLGMKVFERSNIPAAGTSEQKIDLRPVAKGFYSVVLRTRDRTVVKKALVR